MKEVQRFYDSYFCSTPSRVSSDAFKGAITEPLRPHVRGLTVDVACGKGDMLEFLVRKCLVSGLGLDLSLRGIQEARCNWSSPRLHYIAASATALPLRGGCADGVTIFSALYIMPRKDDVLTEAWRVLKPGGYLFIADPPPIQRRSLHFAVDALVRATEVLLGWTGVPRHGSRPPGERYPLFPETQRALRERVSQTGFEILESRTGLFLTTAFRKFDVPAPLAHLLRRLDRVLEAFGWPVAGAMWLLARKPEKPL